MAEAPPSSSPGSHYEAYQIPLDSSISGSSPPRQTRSQKPRKAPTVTPKRFTKFFTPRNAKATLSGGQSKAGRQLRDITKNGANRRLQGLAASNDFLVKASQDLQFTRPNKRRKLSQDFNSSPPRSSPLKHVQTVDPLAVFDHEALSPTASDLDSLPDLFKGVNTLPKPIQRLREPGPARRLLERSLGGHAALGRGYRGPDHCADPRAETANFVSTPGDIHQFQGSALPFCTASCNTNSLIAVGDEAGSVRLMDSSLTSDFTKAHLKIRVHHNAIMDVAFSPDDYLLVTAGGDQTARLVDMHTQQILCVLAGHTSSVKQARFQPGAGDVITTSSKDGSVMVWDLRVGGKSAMRSLRTWTRHMVDGDADTQIETRYNSSVLNVGNVHRSSHRPMGTYSNEVSITTFQHLPHGREHLILTASEVNASVKLWDIRTSSRRSEPIPLSSTPPPAAHRTTRNYGINSMVLSGDGARLYTVCRDATVYAYSTSHLALGHVPEMAVSSRRRHHKEPHTGLGPLYGFRNPSLRTSTFYIKAALRPARGDQAELLAVGSSDRCPVLFPTDEKHLLRRRPQARDDDEDEHDEDDADLPTFPPKSSQRSSTSLRTAPSDTQISQCGTPLARAHRKEVTSLAWTHEGDLVSVSDDYSARCWREDEDKARGLRLCGEGGGTRWGCGWAEVDADWDEVDC